jgi:Fe-S oxidoreductase
MALLELVAALCSAGARNDGVVAALAAVLLLLQQRCDVAAREAATLQCCGAAVRDNGGRQRTKQGWRTALELATTAGSRAGRRRYAALHGWQAAAAEIFVFF